MTYRNLMFLWGLFCALIAVACLVAFFAQGMRTDELVGTVLFGLFAIGGFGLSGFISDWDSDTAEWDSLVKHGTSEERLRFLEDQNGKWWRSIGPFSRDRR